MCAMVIAGADAPCNRNLRVAPKNLADPHPVVQPPVSARIGDTARLLRMMATCHAELPAIGADLPFLATEAARRLRDNAREIAQERLRTLAIQAADELESLTAARVKPITPWRQRDGFLAVAERLTILAAGLERLDGLAQYGARVGATGAGRRAAA